MNLALPNVKAGLADLLALAECKYGGDVRAGLIVFDDEGYGFRKEENRIVFYEKLADFFERHLKTAKTVAADGAAECRNKQNVPKRR